MPELRHGSSFCQLGVAKVEIPSQLAKERDQGPLKTLLGQVVRFPETRKMATLLWI